MEKFWFQVERCFFLVFLEFFWFCLVGQNSSLSTAKEFYETSRKPKNQKTKTFWRSFGFRSKDGFFWFSLSFFGFVWWARTLLFQQKRSFTKPRENQKTKTFWRSFGFRSKDGFFWFSLSFFGFFWFRFLKTKKNFGFFGFLKEVLLEERQKTKKTQGFLFFWSDV